MMFGFCTCVAVLLCCFTSAICVSEEFLNFIPVDGVDHKTLFYEHPGPKSPIEVDASMTQQIRIRIIEHLNDLPKLRIHCIVAALKPDYELVSASLCFRKTLGDHDECIDPRERNLIFGSIEFKAFGNRTSGYTFQSRLPVQRQLLDGFYSCKFRNINGRLSSNFVEIQDVYNYHKRMVKRTIKPVEYLNPITINDLPMQLDCGESQNSNNLPSWADATFPTPFMWSFCDLDDSQPVQQSACVRRVRRTSTHVSDYFESNVSPNGTLVLYKRTATSWKNMGLICWSHLESSAVYSTYFSGSAENPKLLSYDGHISFVGHDITILSPLTQEFTVRQGPLSLQQIGLRLVASYRSNPETTDAQWTMNGGRIPSDFPERTEYILKFPPVINFNHSGIYNLLVQHDQRQTKFQYIVKVVGPPEVIRPPAPLILLMEGKNLTFSTEIHSFLTVSLEINGWKVPSGPATSLEPPLRDAFPYLKDTVIQPLHQNGPLLTYSAYNLYFTPGSQFGPSHTVSIVASNNFGLARVSTLVRVLPRPNVVVPASKFNCTRNCMNVQSHKFDCMIDLKAYDNVYVLQTWEFNGIDISKMNKEDRTSKFLQHVGTELILSSVDKSMVELFSDTKLTCRYRIYYPEVTNTSHAADLEARLLNPKYKVYDSNDDLKIQPLLTAYLHLQADMTAVAATANISWITAVLIAIAIIIAIGVLTTFIVMRSRGETYLLDREERALGNDPEKELREKEAFQTYERAEEPPLRGSRCSLNDDSAEIGSDADGELDDYNLDPGKFNEEGSFIGEYTSEKHRTTPNRLPHIDGGGGGGNYNPHA